MVPSDVVVLAIMCMLAFFGARISPKFDRSTFVTFVSTIAAAYVIISCAFAILDLCNLMRERKIQQDACTSRAEYARIALRTSALFLLVVVPALYLFWMYAMPRRRSLGFRLRTETSLVAFVAAFVMSLILAETTSWLIHKGLHMPPFFEHVHKYHHMHIAPVAFASIDAHPLEILVWDLLPLALGPILAGAGTAFTVFFGVFGVVQTLAAHCGYSLGLYFDGRFHDLHHERMKCNYGGNMFMDALFGTRIERETGRAYARWDKDEKTLDGSHNIRCNE